MFSNIIKPVTTHKATDNKKMYFIFFVLSFYYFRDLESLVIF
jgi:hypothetical protein